MTEEQKKYYNAMKKLGSKKPQKPIPRPLVSAPCGKTPGEGSRRAGKGASALRPLLTVHPERGGWQRRHGGRRCGQLLRLG